MSKYPRRRAHWFREQTPSSTIVKTINVFVAPEVSASYHQGYSDGALHSWETDKELSTLARLSYGVYSSFQWAHYFRGFKDGYERKGRSLTYGENNRESSG